MKITNRIQGLILCTAFSLSALAQTIVNPSFEKGFDGWEYRGLQLQNNSSFKVKAGSNYAEKWKGRGDKIGDAYVSQTVTNVPFGIYDLTVAAQNIQEGELDVEQTGAWIFADKEQTTVTSAKDYTVRFICTTGEVTIGFEAKGATGNWISVDNFRLKKANVDPAELKALFKEMLDATEKYAERDMYPADKEKLMAILKEAHVVYDADDATQFEAMAGKLLQAQKDAERAIYEYERDRATPDNLLDVTQFIVNPDFEDGTKGWDYSNLKAQGNKSFQGTSGDIFMENWVSSGSIGDAHVRQAVAELGVGKYILKCKAQNIQQNSSAKQQGAYVFFNDVRKPVYAAGEYTISVTHIDGKMEIGFVAEGATGNWICVDDFRLYFAGHAPEGLSAELSTRIATAEALLTSPVQTSLREALEQAVEAAKDVDEKLATSKLTDELESELTMVADRLKKATWEAQVSANAFKALLAAITSSEKAYGEGTGANADLYRASIDAAKAVYNDLTSSVEALTAQLVALQKADLSYRVDNATGNKPKVTTDPRYVHGCQEVFGRMSVSGVSASNIKEQGFVYSETNPQPTVLDERSTDYLEHNGKIYRMPMKAGTLYYIRAYCMTKNYAVGYGDVIRVSTLPQGNVTWSYDYNANEQEQNDRTETALREAAGWWSNYTSIRGFNIHGNFNYGTETANCGYGGYMSMGPNMGQKTGTVLHEMNHGVGCGTIDIWGGNDPSPLRVTINGDWAGDRANKAIQFWEDDDKVVIHGFDGAHWGIHYPGQAMEEGGGGTALWMSKYAINGCHLDKGEWAGPKNWNDEQVLFIGNSIITQGFMEDGLVPVNYWSGGVCLPTYTFAHLDDAKYYLTNEDSKRGRLKSYLVEQASGALRWVTSDLVENPDLDADGDGMNDRAAWYVSFDAQNQVYQFRNAVTGHYISDTGTTMKAITKEKLTKNENFTLMRRREVNAGDDPYLGYWITNYTSRYSLQANASGSIGRASQNLWDTSTTQRWLILTAEEAQEMSINTDTKQAALLAELVKNLREVEKVPYIEYNASADSHTPFVEALEAAEALLANSKADVDELSAMYTATRAAGINYLSAVAAEGKPFDLTFFMTNPSVTTDTKGWSESGTMNHNCCEFYVKTFDFNQTLTEMPRGRFVATVQGFQRPGSYSNAYADFLSGGTTNVNFYLGSHSTKLAHIGVDAQQKRLGGGEAAVGSPTVYIPDNMEAADIYFGKGLYENSIEHNQISKNKDLKLGIKCSSVSDQYWTIFRNFHLYFYGRNLSTDIDEVEVAENDIPIAYYSLSGVRIARPDKGAYIIKYKDGRTLKVMR